MDEDDLLLKAERLSEGLAIVGGNDWILDRLIRRLIVAETAIDLLASEKHDSPTRRIARTAAHRRKVY